MKGCANNGERNANDYQKEQVQIRAEALSESFPQRSGWIKVSIGCSNTESGRGQIVGVSEA